VKIFYKKFPCRLLGWGFLFIFTKRFSGASYCKTLYRIVPGDGGTTLELGTIFLFMEEEVWKPIKGWNGKYWISSHGRFKSFGIKYSKKCPDGYVTFGHKDTQGYKGVTMRGGPGVYISTRIHIIVCEHFNGDRPDWAECVNHKDGNKKNNYYKNLEWSTIGNNVKHAVETGLMNLKGQNHPAAKLTNEKVIKMRELRKQGFTYSELGEMFGVERRQASDVVRGVNWGWLKIGL
jgi:hypothetical protein